ncbi:gliotoxin biosynthesis protein [Ophiostoma piceae UAMH 11346]|uniref:gamma-glutamylcyclotransferase n=1 Tax=Ophiostoma piceae (strain UAMH 11346) TaxID=1262450 RepID=S3CD47_OPHP1|nr:gliotoxin biosynthesis protein [Ophiostoma piceae UAMH 11346]
MDSRNGDVVIDMGDDWSCTDADTHADTHAMDMPTLRPETENAPPIEPAATASFWSALWSSTSKQHAVKQKPSRKPIRKRLPRTSDARIAEAVPAVCPDGPILASKLGRKRLTTDTTPGNGTVLYLAYGSNMAAKTFQGTRGIKPLSAVPVSAPTLRLTFDLPGLPYREPCFANTAVRKLPKVPKRPDIPDIPDIPDVPDVPDIPVPQPPSTGPINPPFGGRHFQNKAASRRPIWSGPLYGVVYEVTAEDYATIIATEGGGASYQEVVVPCVAEQPRMGVPERPIQPPSAFLAKTLWAPQLPSDDQGEAEGGKREGKRGKVERGLNEKEGDDDDDDEPTWKDVIKQKWDDAVSAVIKFSAGRMRADPEYAQPSARYLGLLTTGAAEHELPDLYQEWLASLAPYEVTHWRQHLGALCLLFMSLPFLFLIVSSKYLKLENGRMPVWAQVASGAAMHGLWVVYDHVLLPIFGDGEHTEEEEEDSQRSAQRSAHGYDANETTPLTRQLG